MSVIWDFLCGIYEDINDFIREEIKNDLLRAIAFLLFLVVIIGAPLLIILVSIPLSPIYLSKWIGFGIIIFIVIFEILSWIGRALKKPDFGVKS